LGFPVIVQDTNYLLSRFFDVVLESSRIRVGEVRKILIIFAPYRLSCHDSRQVALQAFDDIGQHKV